MQPLCDTVAMEMLIFDVDLKTCLVLIVFVLGAVLLQFISHGFFALNK